ncbi:MAG: DUF2142 domain-containing protein [Lachnospiraceae bacterium]|nr:DUF2142 domain-containing protein [Lachnospiraceae bacterium]
MSFAKKMLFAASFILGLSAAIEFSLFHIRELLNEKTQLTILSNDMTWHVGDPFANYKIQGMSDGSRHIYEDPVYTAIPMNGFYLSRFSFDYRSDENFLVTTVLSQAEQSQTITYHGYDFLACGILDTGVKPLHDYADTVLLITERINAPKITKIHFSNQLTFDWKRFFLFAAGLTAVWFLLFERKTFYRHIAIPVFFIILFTGLTEIMAHGLGKSGNDEQIHFANVYQMAYPGRNYLQTPAYYQFYALEVLGGDTPEEASLIAEYIDTLSGPSFTQEKDYPFTTWAQRIGHVGMSFVWRICSAFGAPFSICIFLADLINLLIYAVCMSVAVQICRTGRSLMLLLGLMPTPIFISAHLTYNATLMGFIALSFALYSKEYREEAPLSKIRVTAMLFFAITGILIKAVYFPLILCFVILPKYKFQSVKGRIAYSTIVLCASIAVLASFLLPLIFSPAGANPYTDPRGGATDANAQILSVMSHPCSYIAILFRQIAFHFYDYHLGKEAWTYFAYGGYYQGWLLFVVSTAIIGIGLLAGSAEDAAKNVIPMKIGTFSFALIAEMLVYSALYVSFTPVGTTDIIGVQGYYMIPLVWPLILILWNRKLGDLLHIRKMLGQSGWYGITLGLSSLLLVVINFIRLSPSNGWVISNSI